MQTYMNMLYMGYACMCRYVCVCEHVKKKETYHTISPDLFPIRDHQNGIKTV